MTGDTYQESPSDHGTRGLTPADLTESLLCFPSTTQKNWMLSEGIFILIFVQPEFFITTGM